jgi:hypothetical protein
VKEKAARGVERLIKRHIENTAQEVADYIKKQVEEAIMGGILPVPYMLQLMRDDSNPPTFRAEMAKATAGYIHGKTAEQKSSEPEVRNITEIRRVIVQHRPEHSDSPGLPASPWRSEI